MPLCSKCNQNETTIQFTTVVVAGGEEGVKSETVDFCSNCSPPDGLDLKNLDIAKLKAMSVIGKKCEFCGQAALSGITGAAGTIYWCFDAVWSSGAFNWTYAFPSALN